MAKTEATDAPHPLVSTVGRYLTQLGVILSHPAAFVAAILYTAGWACASPETFDWHAGATLAALFMTLFIQRATHRDTQALHAKIDELLRVTTKASDDLTAVDDEEPEIIEQRRQTANAGNAEPG